MAYLSMAFGWVWSRKGFFGLVLASALFFFGIFFPFGDLSDAVTTAIARGSGNQVYVQFDTLDLSLFPQPAITAAGVSIETSLPPLTTKWAKITPGLFNMLLNINTFRKAGEGDPEAVRAAPGKISFSFDAEDLLGSDVEFSMSPGKKGQSGQSRSRVALAVEKLNLAEVQRWADLSVKMQGRADFETDMQVAFDFSEQPEGEYTLQLAKFNIPAGIVQIPSEDMNGEPVNIPMSLPGLSLQNAVLKGRLTNGQLFIEEGRFGTSQDPISGRIKGNLNIRFVQMGPQVVPQMGQYNLTVELNASAALIKELSLPFMFLEAGKASTTASGSKYLFRAAGPRFGVPPTITRIDTF